MSTRARLTGLALKTARQDRGLSMSALARLAGLDRKTVERIEGKRQVPRNRTRERLSRALEVDSRVIAIERARRSRAEDARVHGLLPGTKAHLREVVPWPDDPVARYAVDVHPEGLPAGQIAQVLTVSVDTVESDLVRVTRRLREAAQHDSLVREWLALVLAMRAERVQRETLMCAGYGG